MGSRKHENNAQRRLSDGVSPRSHRQKVLKVKGVDKIPQEGRKPKVKPWGPKVKFEEMSKTLGKDPDAGKDQKQKERRVAEDEMLRRHHRLNGHELQQTPGNRGG